MSRRCSRRRRGRRRRGRRRRGCRRCLFSSSRFLILAGIAVAYSQSLHLGIVHVTLCTANVIIIVTRVVLAILQSEPLLWAAQPSAVAPRTRNTGSSATWSVGADDRAVDAPPPALIATLFGEHAGC